jgi:protein-disulfide isomerase
MSRSRTRERRKEREQQQRRQRQIVFLIGLVVVAVIAIVVVILTNQPAEAPIPAESLDRYTDISQSETQDGYPILGDPEAPVQLVEYSSFDCPHCQEFHEGVFNSLVDRIRAGELAFTFVPIYGTGGITNGQGAARAAVCASQQGAFWAYHDALFNWQIVYGNQAFSQNRLASGIDNLGIDRTAWDQCMGSDLPDSVIMSPTEASRAVEGFTGTPMVVINGAIVPPDLASVNTAIDQALASAPLIVPDVETTVEPEIEITAEATAEATDEP